MTILAIVNANKEGQIESKMMKSRQMEEIREARRKEAEARQEQRSSKLVYDVLETEIEKPEIDNSVGGDQGLDAQEEEKEVKCWCRHGPFREQLKILKRRQS